MSAAVPVQHRQLYIDGQWCDSASGKKLAVKDLFDIAGIRTTYGSKIYAEHVPERVAHEANVV